MFCIFFKCNETKVNDKFQLYKRKKNLKSNQSLYRLGKWTEICVRFDIDIIMFISI